MKADTQSTDLPPPLKIALVNAITPRAACRIGPLRSVLHANNKSGLKTCGLLLRSYKMQLLFCHEILSVLRAPL